MKYWNLVSVAIILISTKALGDLTNRFNLTQVVGALLAGVLIGPCCLGMITETDFITESSEIGVVLLMFVAGMDTDVKLLKENCVACIVIAAIGVFLPLLGGTAAYYFFFEAGTVSYEALLKAVFIGVVLTATSVSITAEALREMGRLEGRVGSAIMGAAVIDDIIGILVLTVVISMKTREASVGMVFVKIAAYALLMSVIAFLLHHFRKEVDDNLGKKRITTIAVAVCFLISFASEYYFGIADITGAYLFGLFLSENKIKQEIHHKLSKVSYLIFSPIFFASIGLKVTFDGLTLRLCVFALILFVVAAVTKIIGCGLGAKICHFTNHESLEIGIGMISRGEVALIVAQKGFDIGLVDQTMFPPIIIVVILTTVITPILLKKFMDAPNRRHHALRLS